MDVLRAGFSWKVAEAVLKKNNGSDFGEFWKNVKRSLSFESAVVCVGVALSESHSMWDYGSKGESGETDAGEMYEDFYMDCMNVKWCIEM